MKITLKALLALSFSLLVLIITMAISVAAPGQVKVNKPSVGVTSATISWSASSNADGYIVQLAEGDKWKTVGTLDASKKKLTIKNLKPGKTYKYRVRAFEKNGKKKVYSVPSSTVTVKPAIKKVTGLKATSTSATSVKLTWKKVSGVTGYRVERLNGKKWVTVKTLKAKYNYANISGLKNGSTQKFRVKAYLTISKKNYFSAASSTLSYKVNLAKPVLKASNTYNTITVKWNKVPGATAYQVYNTTTKKWVTKKTTNTSVKLSKLATGTKYSIKVRALQKVKKTNYYSAYTTVTVTPTLSKVTGIAQTGATSVSVSLKWNAVKGANGYSIYRLGEDGKWKEIAKTTGTTNKNIVDFPETKYTYRIRAYRVVNKKEVYSAYSSNFVATSGSLKGVNKLVKESATDNSITISWNDVGAAKYIVYNGEKIAKITEESMATVVGLKPGTSYSFRVVAIYTIKGIDYPAKSSTALLVKTTGERPTEPSTEPTKPSEPSTEPSTKPTEPSTKPTEPSTKPTDPTKPTTPACKHEKITSSVTTKPTCTTAGVETYKCSDCSYSFTRTLEPLGHKYSSSITKEATCTRPGTKTFKCSNCSYSYEEEIKMLGHIDENKDNYCDRCKTNLAPYKPPVFEAPDQVTGLKTTAQTKSSIEIQWTPSATADNYIIYFRKKGTTDWSKKETVTPKYNITGLAENTEYEVYVVAKDGDLSADPSATITAKTKANEVVTNKELTAKSVGATEVELNWASVAGAYTYTLQYYDVNKWLIVPGAQSIEGTSFKDDLLSSASGRLYRVVANNKTGDSIKTTAPVIGTASGLTVNADNYKAEIKWDSVANASSYTLYSNYGIGDDPVWKPVKGATKLTTNSVTIYLAPGAIHSFTLMAALKDNSSKSVFSGLSIVMPELNVNSDSDEVKNSQLLYLAHAINLTKFEQTKVKVTYKNTTSSTIDYLKNTVTLFPILLPGEHNGVKEVDKFFQTIDPTMKAEDTTVVDENIDFLYGVGKNSKGRQVDLDTFLEPSTNSADYYMAYIYDSNKPSAWRNGFSSVTTKSVAGGGYEITAVLKKESVSNDTAPKYHSGLCESVSAINDAAGSGVDITSASVGLTTIKAKINKNGTLDSYSVTAPFDCNLSMNMGDMGITIPGSITMHMKGNSNSTYTFTR